MVREPPYLFFILGNWGHSGHWTKLQKTKGHHGQLVVKNTLKVDNGLRTSKPNQKRAGSGLGGLVTFKLWFRHYQLSYLNSKTCSTDRSTLNASTQFSELKVLHRVHGIPHSCSFSGLLTGKFKHVTNMAQENSLKLAI